MRHVAAVFVVLCLLLVCGCDQSRMMRAFGSPADEKAATHYIDLLLSHQYTPIERDIDPSFIKGVRVIYAP